MLDLVCIVPVYNEDEVLDKSIRLLANALKKQPFVNWELVIASNGSTDNTDSVARQLEHSLNPRVRLFKCSGKGRGRALKEVIGSTPARSYLYLDVDLPLKLNNLSKLLSPLSKGVDIVISRRTGSRPIMRRCMTFGLRCLNYCLFGLHASDSQCAIKALSERGAKVLVNDCKQDGWFLDTELVVLSESRGLNRVEVPIDWIERRFHDRTSKVDAWRDSAKAARALLQIWLRRRVTARQNHNAK